MRVKRRTLVKILLALVALCLFVTWLEGGVGLSSGRSQLVVRCDGKADEERFLLEQAGTTTDGGHRRFTSADGFVVYRIPIGGCELERVFFRINRAGYHLEFSPDGREWSTLARFGKSSKGNGQEFGLQSCGFPTDGKRTASRTGTAYFRFRTADKHQESYPAIKYLKLEVSGSVPPEHFQRYSLGRKLIGFLPARLMVLIGLGAVYIGKKCWRTPWRLFGAGALLWMVSVAAKLGFALVADKPVADGLRAVLPPFPADLALWLYIGLLTGIFECGIFLLVARRIRRNQWNWSDAASLGVGFGAMEAVAVGVGAAIGAGLSSEISAGLDLGSSFVGPVERLIALAVHTASVVMIIYALTQRKWSWFAAAFLYKSGVDTLAAFVLLSGMDWLKTHPWFVELCWFGPFALVGLCILPVLKRVWDRGREGEVGPDLSRPIPDLEP